MCLLTCHLAYSQITGENDTYATLEQYASHLVRFNRYHPQEKVYVHMDNRSYYVGDTLFFKAYVMNATTHRPTMNSKVLYVELLDERGIEVEHQKLKIVNGSCHGNFILENNYRTGYYELRAYTRYMLNFGNEPMPWINIQQYISESKLNPYAITTEQRIAAPKSSSNLLSKIYPTPIWEQSIVPEANHCLYSRVFPIYMRPKNSGEYKHQMDWYPMHGKLAYPQETEDEFRKDSLRVDFFPEGGTLVTGITSRVAIDISDQWGREIQTNGYIAEDRNTNAPISYFSTGERGRGSFYFCPQEGKQYYAYISYKGMNYRYALPISQDRGYVLNMTPPIGRGEASFLVKASQSMETPIGWTLTCRGALAAFDTLDFKKEIERKVVIPSNKLIPGVNQLTLFNTKGEILAERLFFVCPQKQQAFLKLQTQYPDTLQPFEKITLYFQSKASNKHVTQAHFSISITDAHERIATFDTGDIRSEMLLSSEIKGFIKNVDSYFSHTNDTVMANDIDLLMLVQGWRRYEWKTLSGVSPYQQRYTPELGLQLDGYVISSIVPESEFALSSNYQRMGNLSIHVSVRSPLITLSDTFHVDSLGFFHVDFNRDFFGEIPMSIALNELEGKKKKKEGIYSRLKFAYPIISRVFSPSTIPYDYYQDHTPEEDKLLTITNNDNWAMDLELPNVDIKKQRKSSKEINLDSPDIVIDYYKEWNNIIDRGIPNANYYDSKDYYIYEREHDKATAVLYGYEEDAITSAQNENNEIRMHYTLGRSRLWGRISRLSDSIYTYNEGRRNRYRVYLMPKSINVYTNLISRNALGEIIDGDTDSRPYVVWKPVYQKRSLSPQTAPYMLKNGVRHTYYEGYSRVVSFYHRDYSECVLPDSSDYRRTLYWEPNVWTDHLGRASVSFYNNARTKHLHIRAEGFTRNGEFIVYDSDDCL